MASTIVATQHLDPYPRLDPAHLRAEFVHKSILITGGGYGIGASIARAFAAVSAASIILCGRSEDQLNATSRSLHLDFPSVRVTYYVVDIASPSSVRAMFAQIAHKVDVLVNNAGFLPAPANFLDADLQDWWRGFDVNVRGTALVTQAFLQKRRADEAGEPATVVTLNTIGAYAVRVPHLSAYGASKAALARMMELIAVDVPESVARFISVHPGAVKTLMGAKSGLEGAFPATDARLAAEFIVWSASAEASFLAGRFAWVNWDIDELVGKKDVIVAEDLLRTSLKEE